MKRKNHRRLWLIFDRALAQNLLRQLVILCMALIAALGLSYLFLSWSGTQWEDFCKAEHINKWLLPLYLLIDSNALNNLYMGNDGTHVHGWMLFASSMTFLFGAFVFNGVTIGIITNSIEQRVISHREGHIHYLKSGHYIIMGYDEIVPSFITHIFGKDKDAYVLILTSAETIGIREKLMKSFSEKQMKHVIINYGHRVSTDAFKDIHLETAEQIFVVGNHSKPAHDAINVECVDSICRYLSEIEKSDRPARITCVFKDLDTYAAFKNSEIFRKVRELGVEFIPYNCYTDWAKQIFIKREYKYFDNPTEEPYKYPLVYGKGITPKDDKYVHLVFVGTTNFAVAFAMEAAHLLHFPNFDTKGVKTKITFIDRNAGKEKDEFIIRNRHFFEVQSYTYRDLSNNADRKVQPNTTASYFGRHEGYEQGKDYDFLDVEFEFIKGDVFSEEIQEEIRNWSSEHNTKQYLSIFLAMADQRQNFVMSMNMPDETYDKEVPLFIRQDRSANFITNLRNGVFASNKYSEEDNKKDYYRVDDRHLIQERRNIRYSNIYPFGMNETAYSADEKSLERAKLINYLYSTANYETYKFQSVLVLDAMQKDKILEEANVYWNNLSVALKWSNLYNAYSMRIKLDSLRAMRKLDIDDISRDFDKLSEEEAKQLAIVEHNRWNVEKLLMGYRKARKEEDKYEHTEYSSKLGENKNLFIHHDIRPYNDLNIIKKLDIELSRYIPWIIKMTEDND